MQRHNIVSLHCIIKLMYTLQFDGMLRTIHNDWQTYLGLLGYGWLIERNHMEVAHGYGIFVGRSMVGSNIAEYLALIEGLNASLEPIESGNYEAFLWDDYGYNYKEIHGDRMENSSFKRSGVQAMGIFLILLRDNSWGVLNHHSCNPY
jgi:ribonuclease HI